MRLTAQDDFFLWELRQSFKNKISPSHIKRRQCGWKINGRIWLIKHSFNTWLQTAYAPPRLRLYRKCRPINQSRQSDYPVRQSPIRFAHKHRLRGLHPHKDKYWETVFNWTSCFKSATSPSILKTDSVTIKVRSNFPTFFQADFSNVHNHYDDNGKRTPAQTDAVNHTGVNEFICQNQTFVVVKAGKIPRLAW